MALFHLYKHRTNKEIEDSIAESIMKIALIQETNPHKEAFEAAKFAEEKRQFLFKLQEQHITLTSGLVRILAETDTISNEEYGKFLLDETGKYYPKLKKDERR
jgi:hypothetical protein